MSSNGQPDSRDPKPRRVVIRQTIADLTRIADEARELRRQPRQDFPRLAMLVADLADIVKTTIEER